MKDDHYSLPSSETFLPLIGWRSRTLPFLIIACFITLALTYGLVVPPFENLDEVEHFEVIRHIAETGRLPAHGIPEAESYHYRQEASQPPLYHLLSAGLVRLLRLETDDAAAAWRLNPWVACGPGAASLYDNRAVLYHDPNRESFPWQGTLLTLHLLRIWSTLLQTVTVIGTYALARLAFPERRGVGLVAMAVVAFNPQFLLVASGVNNDNLLTPLVTVGLYLLLRTWQDGLSAPRSIALGLLIGLAGLTKLSGLLLLPLSLVIILLRAHRPPSPTRQPPLVIGNCSLVIGNCSLVIVHCSLVIVWWFWRNWQLYGDPTALRPMLELVGVRGGSVLQSFLELGTMFRSFWGQLPCSFYPSGFYAFYTALALLSFGGLIWGWRRLARAERATAAILGSWFLLIIASWARWNAMTPAPGGRLLFPALPAVALLMALGISHYSALIRRPPLEIGHWTLVIGNCSLVIVLLLMACWTVFSILPGFFAPPTRYLDADAVHPAYPLDAALGDEIRLLGYDLDLDDQELMLDLTLYWQALAPMADDYVLALQLVSPVPGDTTLRWNYNSWPGHGNYPTSAWQPGEVIADHYHFHLSEVDFLTQAWDLHLILYREETGERLPVQLDEVAAGDQLMLARLRVPGHSPSCPDNRVLTSEMRFDKAVALTHAWITSTRGGYEVLLCWESLQPLPADYTVFVHLQDASGELIATGDGPPVEGAFPTSMWRPGDVILDTHLLRVAAVEGSGRITVGLYNPEDGSRLPAYVGGEPLPDAAVSVWSDCP
ncbi:MAG: glycosyltransferase family 39 protein [Chloroflexota bacterium]|nr:glycosyltransferase family 39 protein [Chloroflexota bacterium]